MANGFDCATKLNSSSAAALRAAGFDYVARYLGNSWKTFDTAEAIAIQNAGLKLISIFEKNSTKASYFTKSQGMSDAQEAYKYAKAVGQPSGSAIYFTVDYDAQPGDMAAIVEYIKGVKQLLVDYKVGLYGSYAVMMAVKGQIDYYWQTYAWSHGQVADFIHIRQYQNGVTVSGVQLDRDEIRQAPGAWGDVQVPQQGPQIIQRVRALTPTDIRTAPSHDAGFVRNAVVGEEFNVFKRDGDWHCVGGDATGEFWIDGWHGENLYWIDNPNLKQVAAQPYTIKPGDTLSKIASANGTSVSQLQAWNNISNPNKIFAGQRIRVK